MDDPQNDELYPIAILIDELKHDDVLLRLNAIRRLPTIALALGAERTRKELIPFLDDSVEDEDEVLTALGEELGRFVDYVGGPEYGHVLLPSLENLAKIEEPLVRDKAVESLNKICTQLPQQQVEHSFIPLTIRLSKADWFTSKISACGLYTVPYQYATPSSQVALRQQFAQLVRDETPMVRRQSATNLAKFLKNMPPNVVIEEMIPLFQHLAADDQDSVRLLTVDVLIAIAETVPKEQQHGHGVLVTALRSLFEDKSWRVRYMVADRFERIARAVEEEVVQRDLVPAFVKLLKDNEAEVRTAIAGQIPGFCQLVDRQALLRDILPAVEELVSDSSQHVRAAFGNQISGLAPILGRQETTEHLLPMFLSMLRDDFPDVRLNIISKLEQVNHVIGIELLSQSLLPAIVQLAEDKQWRVRLAIIQYLPLLASQLGVKFFNEQLSGLCMSWLGDTVFSIREASTQNLRKLTEVFGVEWAGEHIVPKVAAMAEHQNYLYRMTTCFAVSTLAPALSLPVLHRSVLPILHQLVEDPIPNIRFNAAKSYGVLINIFKRLPNETMTMIQLEKEGRASNGTPQGQQCIQNDIVPPLKKLMEDDDVDVRYFATTAIKNWTEVSNGGPMDMGV
ncbi:protein phosphatase PP2A regulatory subunit A [Piedraia hortae CBS 480.64]|uniref:Protein phosphatase PP2A regulatory subunit A n=1 Tax=Piedraia hortae CBS 480.64 TaxID=1314780 RepID=A0A6A7BU91_9PEZI|nr:protein phosphatase PP2A regulatory subunit A [Piedraia hortae CBS 480.64]